MKFSDLRVGIRISLGFAAVLAATLLVGAVALSRIAVIQANVADLATNWLPSISNIGELRDQVSQLRRAEMAMCLQEVVVEVEKEQERIKTLREKTMPAVIKAYVAEITGPAEEALWKDVDTKIKDYLVVQDKLISFRKQGIKYEYIPLVVGESKAKADAIGAALDKLVQFNIDGGRKAYEDAKKTYDNVVISMLVLIAISLAAGAALAWMLTRSTVQPLVSMVDLARKVADGDLTVRVDASGKDELGQLARALDDMKSALNRSLGTVRHSAEMIAMSSAEVAAGSSDLSARTEQMASSLEETSATMHALTDTVKQNADATRQASQLAQNASQVAGRGGSVVDQVVTTMDEINNASRRIADIIGVIDGIAFQTNILALNAAVEAARAGEQGRGFAVVAGEVRLLAQRSAEAAKEIKGLIGTSVDRVDAGSRLVDEAGSTMRELVTAVQRVTDIIQEISSATQEQSVSLSEVGQAVMRLDEVTQQNAALVEESSAASESLREQAASLQQVVGQFRIAASS